MSRLSRSVTILALAGLSYSLMTPAALAGPGRGGGGISDGAVTTWISVQSDGSFTAPAGFHLRYSFEGEHADCSAGEGRWREWLYYGDAPARGQLTGEDILVQLPGGDGIGLIGGAAGLELVNPGPNHGDVTRPFCGPPPVPDIDVWDAASSELPEPNLSLSPRPVVDGLPTGVTGMELWLWFDPGAPGWDPPEVTVSVSASAGGLATRVDAWIAAVRWDFDNGDSASIGFVEPGTTTPPSVDHYRSIAGTEAEPAGTYLYETKGLYGLAIEVIWTGRFELFDTAGNSLGTYPLDPYTDTETLSYRVLEIRSILTK